MFITNGRSGDTFCLLARTNQTAEPKHKGISCFVVEKGGPGFRVGPDLDKLGYRGPDTCELIFQDYRIPAGNLVGDQEGQGFGQVMSGLETGRINIAARAVGVAQAAFGAAIRYAQQRHTFGVPIAEHQAIQLKLADMATKIQAARLLTYDAAAKKDRGERVDLESGMAITVRQRSLPGSNPGGYANPRRVRVYQGVPGGAILPGRAFDGYR